MQQQTSNISSTINSQSPIADSRLPWLDFASGIMILWMIVFHAIGCAWGYEIRGLWGINDASLLPEGVHAFINSEEKLEVLNPCVVFPWLHFFMPWFFYKSGQFFKKSSRKELWKKDSQKLLKTFLIWSAIGYVFFVLISLLNDSFTLRKATYSVARGLLLRGQVPINEPCWFLLTLFGVRIIANNILPDREDKYAWFKIIFVVIVGYVVSYLSYRFNHRLLPYWVANGAAGLSFFALGYALRDVESKWWLIIPCVVICVVCSIIGFPMVSMLNNELLSGIYLLNIPVSCCCIVVFNNLCMYLYKYLHFNLKILELIGQHAMTIYVVHMLIMTLTVEILRMNDVSLSANELLCLIILVYTLTLPLCCWLKNMYLCTIKNRYFSQN